MQIGGVKAHGGFDRRVQRGAVRKAAAQAQPHRADNPRALRVRLEEGDGGVAVRVVRRHRLTDLARVAASRVFRRVRQDAARRQQLVIYLWDRDDEPVPRDEGRRATDGARHLEDFRIQDHPGVLAGRLGAEHVWEEGGGLVWAPLWSRGQPDRGGRNRATTGAGGTWEHSRQRIGPVGVSTSTDSLS